MDGFGFIDGDQPPLPDPGEELFCHVRLARSPRVGTATFQRLMAEYGTAERALEALPHRVSRSGKADYCPAPKDRIEEEIARASAAGARPLLLGHPGYPARLAEIDDAPPILWALGDCALAHRPTVALVGARNASALGQRLAANLAKELGAAGQVIVSGMARGIDRAAHMASLETGSIAVLAGGVDVVYPRQNSDLAAALSTRGLLLSEAPMGLQPLARHFPKRNRIIAGLSQATVLIEAAERSGSLITARMALEQGRDVMAVPGNPLDGRAAGCNALIRQGAALIRDAADVLEALDTPIRQTPLRTNGFHDQTGHWMGEEPLPDRLHQMLHDLITTAPVPEDTLIRHLGLPVPQVVTALMDMELAGQIDRHAGGLISRRV
ncbi:DNA processing protein [Rubricella aquisinus]|uniref:DNA processing protein n=1 Tax=Rubricella aquisinus TaxID=2028108 RepID=A0A840WJR6_9RHOB|nr:DNA-processing protein DprA [Rubricella aquisinus]MBB5514423.1 DNA processing protein [Rubricella aquisinus]